MFKMGVAKKIEGKKPHTALIGGTNTSGRSNHHRAWNQNNTAAHEGGEVTNPFQRSTETLDDPLPDEMQGKTEGNKPTQLSQIPFLQNSAKSSAGSTDGTSISSSVRKILSLRPSSNSSSSPATSKTLPTDDSKDSSGNVVKGNFPDKNCRVSHRSVAGMDYISCLNTNVEYSVPVFRVNTDDCRCSFCKRMVDVKEVGIILSSSTFLCLDCVSGGTLPLESPQQSGVIANV